MCWFIADDFIHWPTLFIEVLSLDSWERFRTEGYTYLTIPSKAGEKDFRLTWSYDVPCQSSQSLLNSYIRELKRWWRWRLQKCRLKSESALPQTLSRLFLSKFRKRKRKLLPCVPILNKTGNEALSRCSRATTAKKCTKKRDARTKLLFCQSKPIAFFPLSLLSPSSLLKLPIILSGDVTQNLVNY